MAYQIGEIADGLSAIVLNGIVDGEHERKLTLLLERFDLETCRELALCDEGDINLGALQITIGHIAEIAAREFFQRVERLWAYQ